MRLSECGTLVPGALWYARSRRASHTRSDDDAEVVRRAIEHMKSAHGETIIRQNMVDYIKERIRDEAGAA